MNGIDDMTEKAPWKDFGGNDLFEGDTIVHPDGSSGVIVLNNEFECDSDRWLVKYQKDATGFSTPMFSRLCLQVGEKGRAVKTNIADKFILALKHRNHRRCFYSCMEDADYYGTRQFMSCDKLGYAEEFASEYEAIKFKNEHDADNLFEVMSLHDAEKEYDRLLSDNKRGSADE